MNAPVVTIVPPAAHVPIERGEADAVLAGARMKAHQPKLPRGAMPSGTAGRILEAALVLFAQSGYHGTSIRDIGQKVGLKPANLYDHFASKEHVLAELVRVGHEEHLRSLTAALVGAGGGPIEQVQALVRAHVRLHAEYAMLAIVAFHEMHVLSQDLVAPALALRQQAELLLMGVVQRGVQLGLFAPPDPLFTAVAIGSMGMRVAHWFRPTTEQPTDYLCDIYAELAVRMLEPRSAARAEREST